MIGGENILRQRKKTTDLSAATVAGTGDQDLPEKKEKVKSKSVFEHATDTVSNIHYCTWAIVGTMAARSFVLLLKDGWKMFFQNVFSPLYIVENIESFGFVIGLYFAAELYKTTMVSSSPDIDSMYQYTDAMDVMWFFGGVSNTVDSLWTAFKMDKGNDARFLVTKQVGATSAIALAACVIVTNKYAARVAEEKPLAPSSKSSKSGSKKIDNEALRKKGFELAKSQFFYSGTELITALLICLKSLKIADMTERIFGFTDALEPLYFIWLISTVRSRFLSLIINMTSNENSKAGESDVIDLVQSQGRFFNEFGTSTWFFTIIAVLGPITDALIPIIPGLKELIDYLS